MVYDGSSGAHVANLAGHSDYSFAAAWHPDGNVIATGNQVRCWGRCGLHFPRPLPYYECPPRSPKAAACAPLRLSFCTPPCRTCGCNFAPQSEHRAHDDLRLLMPTPSPRPAPPRPGPQNKQKHTNAQDMTTRLWDLRMPSRSFALLKAHIGAIRALRFSPCGRFLAAAEPADYITIYDAAAGCAGRARGRRMSFCFSEFLVSSFTSLSGRMKGPAGLGGQPGKRLESGATPRRSGLFSCCFEGGAPFASVRCPPAPARPRSLPTPPCALLLPAAQVLGAAVDRRVWRAGWNQLQPRRRAPLRRRLRRPLLQPAAVRPAPRALAAAGRLALKIVLS